MKTLHYAAHIALITVFAIFAVGIGFYLTGSDESKSAILSIIKDDSLKQRHAPVAVVKTHTRICHVCVELGMSGCAAAAPHHIRHLAADRKRQIEKRASSAEKSSLKEIAEVWIKTLMPERAIKKTGKSMEPDVLMTYAVWE